MNRVGGSAMGLDAQFYRELLEMVCTFERLGASRDVLERIRSQIPEAPAAPSGPVHGLSPRERDILALVGRGLTNKRIANELTITPETVKSHVKRIFSKLDVRTRAAAVSLGLRGGLLRHD